MSTIPGSQSSTTTRYNDIFNLLTTHTGAKATSESLTVALRESVAWALLSLMTVLFIGMLSVVILLCIQKHRQNRNITVDRAEAPVVYEMDGNPCYESSKMDTTYGANIYEAIETERGVQ